MNLQESLQSALDSLKTNKMRAILTMLGVIIGVAAVIALVGIGNGFGNYVEGQINSLGSNLIFVTTDLEQSDGYNTLTEKDMEILQEPGRAPALGQVSALVQGSYDVVAGREENRVVVFGVTEAHFDVNQITELEGGRLFSADDDDANRRVVVLGNGLADDLFPSGAAVGQKMKIAGNRFEVVGVLADSDGGAMGSPNDSLFIPLNTSQKYLERVETRDGERAVNRLVLQSIDSESADKAVEQITAILRQQHDIAYAAEDDFSIQNQADLLDTVGSITTTLTIFLGAIAAISLIVGGIGIMNIMLVSVTERTREIGIRKALGALRRDVLTQFLIESAVLSFAGGIIGIILGYLIAFVGGNAVSITPTITWDTVVLAAGFSIAVGILFGFYPAWRASNLHPIEALRYE